MRVSLFGLFLRCTSLMEPWPKLIQSVLLVTGFTRIFGFSIIYMFMSCLSTYILFHSHLYLSLPAIWHLYHHSPGEFHWLPWILMSRSWSLELEDSSCWGTSLLLGSSQISCSSSPILAFPVGSRLLQLSREHPFVLFIDVHFFGTLAFAPIKWCNIIVIFITSGDNFVIVLMCWNV